MTAKRLLVGNDVVDLRDPRCAGKAGDDRFVDRVFDEEEGGRIRAASDSDGALWIHWAAKEAAFKVVSKLLGSPPTFRHAAFRYRPADDPGGEDAEDALSSGGAVEYRGTRLGVQVERRPDRLHALSWYPASRSPAAIRTGIKVMPSLVDPSGREWKEALRNRFTEREWRSVHRPASALARINARDELSRRIGLPPGALEIVCDPGLPGRMPPKVVVEGEPWEGDVSLSHHGRFLAWAWAAPETDAEQAAPRPPS